jgi:hypothetical protein
LDVAQLLAEQFAFVLWGMGVSPVGCLCWGTNQPTTNHESKTPRSIHDLLPTNNDRAAIAWNWQPTTNNEQLLRSSDPRKLTTNNQQLLRSSDRRKLTTNNQQLTTIAQQRSPQTNN